MNTVIHQQVVDKINECNDILFAKTGRRLDIKLTYNVRGTVAGRGGVRNDQPIVELNPVLLAENTDTMIAQTVPHEFAHAVQYSLFKNVYGSKGHGIIWKNIMGWLKVPATRCHRYDTTKAKVRTVARHEFVCFCLDKVHNITSMRLRKIEAGTSYRCTCCGHKITPKLSVAA